MKNPYPIGAVEVYHTTVTPDKLAQFDAGLVHPVYSTFALAKDAEWACRLFVLNMKEDGEEGIGSFVSVNHVAPAPLGSSVEIRATLQEVAGNKIVCTYQAFCGERLIAEGSQTQRIINKAKFDALIESLKEGL